MCKVRPWIMFVLLGMVHCNSGNDCIPQSSRCEGAQIATCRDFGSHSADWQWMAESCPQGTHCVEGQRNGTTRAACVSASTPNPVCEGGSEPKCDQNTVVGCLGGYETLRNQCLTCSSFCWSAATSEDCCTGSVNDACSTDADCFAELRCRFARATKRNECLLPCSCPDEAPCNKDCDREELPSFSHTCFQGTCS